MEAVAAGRPEWEAAGPLLPSSGSPAGASPSGYTRLAGRWSGVWGRKPPPRRLRVLLLVLRTVRRRPWDLPGVSAPLVG